MVDTSATDLGKMIGLQSRRVSEIEEQGFGSDPGGATLFTPIDTIRVTNDRKVETKQEIGDAFVLGHSYNSQLGTAPYTLGDADLGSSSEVAIAMGGLSFSHTFLNTTFVDTDSTTATLLTGSCIFSSTGEEVFQPVQLHKEEGASITQVRIETDSTDNSNLDLQANTGSGWEDLTQSVFSAVTAGSTLDIRIKNDTLTIGTSWPTAWGTWGTTGTYDPVTLTRVQVNYIK